MNRDYNKELDDFYDNVYRPCMKENGDISFDSEFGIDGLLKRPAGIGGKESELWDKSPLKVVLLLKDKNANDSCIDSRSYKDINNNSFGKNIAAWIYAIFQICNNKIVPSIQEAYDYNNQIKAFREKPYAIINVKKKVGKGSVTDKVVKDYVEKYKEYIRKELDILNPDLILCCGGRNGRMFELAQKNIYAEYSFEQIATNSSIYYCKEANLSLLRAYHPSAHKKKEDIYWNIMDDLKNFLFL